jgi:hypothetical protein
MSDTLINSLQYGSGSARVVKVTYSNNTIVKKITVGSPITAVTSTLNFELNNIVDVNTGGVSDGQYLVYDSDSSLWIPGTVVHYTSAEFDSDFGLKTTTDLAEGTNLYYTVARANSAIDARVDKAFVDALDVDADTLDSQDGSYYLDFANFTGTPPSTYTSAEFDSDFGLKSTTDLAEGSNLYYTQGRFNTAFTAKSTTDLTEGSNLYYTVARANSAFDNRLATKTTTDVSEGTNLYYTDVRVQTKLGNVSGDIIPDTDSAYDIGSSSNKFRDIYLSGNSIYLGNAIINANGSAINLPTLSTANGEVILTDTTTSSDISEGSNLYYTKARVDSDIAATAIEPGTDSATVSAIIISDVDKAFVDGLGVDYNSLTNQPSILDSADVIAIHDAQPGGGVGGTDSATVSLIIIDDVDKAFVDALNVDADTLDLQDGSYYLDYANFVNTPNVLDSADVATIANDLEIVYNGFDSDFASKSTTDLTEGSNLYYTDGRVSTVITSDVDKAFVDALNVNADTLDSQNGTYYLDYSNFTNTPNVLDSADVALIANDLEIVYAGFDSDFASKSTTDLTEGSNLYYTDGRVSTVITSDVDKAFVDALNVNADTLDSQNGTYYLDYANFTSTPNVLDSANVSSIISADVDKTFVDALNVNADTLDSQNGTYYLDYTNFTNTPNVLDSADVAAIANALEVVYAGFDSDFAAKSTSDLTEGTNLYYTELRVSNNSDVAANTTARHTHANKAILDQIEQPFTNLDNAKLDGIDSGANLYTHPANHDWSIITGTPTTIAGYGITDAYDATDFDNNFATKTTADLSEDSNLYYTSARVSTVITADVDKAFVDALNVDADTLDGVNGAAYADKYTQSQVDNLLLGKQQVENGFIDRSESTLSFVNGTRTLTIAPTATNFSFYSDSNFYTKTSENIVIPDTEGVWYVYYNSAGTLTATQTFVEDIISTWAFVATVYWSVDAAAAIAIGDERHGNQMDASTHLYLHNTAGTIYGSGLAVLNVHADSDGADSDQAQIGVASGVIYDEDIKINIGAQAAPANIPILYLADSASSWRSVAATDYVVTTTGTGRAAYNENTPSGDWRLTELADSEFSHYHLVAGNDINDGYFLVAGQEVYPTLLEAQTTAPTSLLNLTLDNFPLVEYKSIATFIIHSKDAFTNEVKTILRTTTEGADYVDWRQTSVSVANSVQGGTLTAWGDITGNLSNQTDLQSALDNKLDNAGTAADTTLFGGHDSSYYLDYNNFNNIPTDFDTEFAAKSTTDLSEGTNQYYTEGRVSANTDVAANTAARHTHANKAILDNITAAYTTEEELKLAGIADSANKYVHPANHPWSFITSTPTTLAGYGITDGYDSADWIIQLSQSTTSDLAEGTNEYYTVARANSAIDARVNKAFVDALNVDADTLDNQDGTYYLDYTNFTNTPNILDSADVTSIHNSLEYTGFDSDFALKTTTDLTEGTNLYYTEARVDANTNVAANTAARHTHANKAILDQIEQPFTNVDNAKLDGIDSGANLYTHPATHDWSIIDNTPTTLAGYGITDGYDSADWETHWGIKTTADLPENTNLYYTEGRVSANTDVAANTAARHTHANKATLDLIEQPFTNVDNNKLDNIDSGANLYVHPVDHPWSFITSTPTTIAGYGITDAYDSATFNAMFAANSTSDLSEGTNLYYTTARADSAIDDRVTQSFVNALNVNADTLDNQEGTYYLNYNNFTNTPNVLDSADVASIANDLETIYNGFDSDFASKSTTDLTEGSNLYYTEGRVSANTDVAANTSARHTHANKAILDQIEQPFTNVDNAKLDGIDSGANLYVHPATHDWSIIQNTPTTLAGYGITDNLFDSADFDTEFTGKSTTDLSEGSNLYYTTARADSDARYAISVSGDLSYDPVTGVVSYTDPASSGYDSASVQAQIDSDFALRTTSELTEGTNLYYTTTRANSAIDARVDQAFVNALNVDADTLDNQNGTYYLDYANFTGTPPSTTDSASVQAQIDSDFALRTTTDLTEGTNLYYTEGRVSANTDVAANTSARHTHANKATLDLIEQPFTNVDNDKLDNIDSGANLYVLPAATASLGGVVTGTDITIDGSGNVSVNNNSHTHTWSNITSTPTTLAGYGITDDLYDSADFTISFAAESTTNLTEGTNLYYTTARADSDAKNAISVTDAGGDGSLGYNNGTGVITYTGPSASEVRAHFSGGTGVDITTGTISIGQPVGVLDSVTFGGLHVTGNLVVSGTTTSINTETLTVDDNIIVLNNNVTGAPTENSGIEIERGTSANRTLLWDETADKWTVGSETFVAATFEGALTGNVSGTVSDISNHSTTDLSEGTNLYYTTTRANSAIDARVDKTFVDALNVDADTLDNQNGTYYLDYANFTGTPPSTYTSVEFDSDFATKSTTDLTEGSNLYYTEGRVSANTDVAANTTARHTHANKATLDLIEQPFTNVDNAKLDGIDSEANLYVHPATHDWSIIQNTPTTLAGYGITDNLFDSADFDTEFGNKSTTDLTEGTNQYFTTSRARSSISASGSLSYDSSTGVMSYFAGGGTGTTVTSSVTAPVDPDSNELWWDAFNGELRIYFVDSDTSQWVDASAKTGPKGESGPFGPKSTTISFPTASEDITLFYTNQNVTISSIVSVLRVSGGSSLTWTLRYGSDRNSTGTEVKTGGMTTTSSTTGDSITVLDNAIISSGNFVWLETTGATYHFGSL